jgi:glycosyltransferase involved in cell wall biosynthesis
MKIMLVTPYFYPKIGGVERHTYNIAKGLIDRGHEVTVLTTIPNSKEQVEDTIDGIPVIKLPISFTISMSPFNFAWYSQIKKVIKDLKPDIIEAHAPVPGLADVAFFAKGNIPFVIKYHSGSMLKGKILIDILLFIYEQTLLRFIFKRSDAIMSVYPNFIDKLIGSNKKNFFIPPGVDLSLFKVLPNTKKTIDILYVGRIEHASAWKGIDVLLEATSIVVRNKPDVQLSFIGSGDAVEHFKVMAKELGIIKNVTFLGRQGGEKLVGYYNQSHLLVLSSTTEAESFGNVLIEAMGCGIPVIGSKIGGIPNVISDNKNGKLVKPNDVVDLAQNISKLLSNPKLSFKFGEQGRKDTIRKFSSSHLIEKTELVLKNVIESKK